MATDNLEIILDDMDRFIGRQITSLTLHIHAELVIETPYDLGWARANWVPQIATPYRVDMEDFEPTAGAAASLSASVDTELYSIVASYNLDAGPIYLSNNVPYIGRLDEGHSKQQAIPGYIQRTVERAVEEKRSGVA